MEYIFFIVVTILLLSVIIFATIDTNGEDILLNDYKYFEKFAQKQLISKLINNNYNPTNVNLKRKNKILFITYDNRKDLEYVEIHNQNIQKYVEKYGYNYKFYNRCDKNTYWCKIYMLLDELTSVANYDYVIWLDSDTVIKNFDIDLGKILNMYQSDIFLGSDNNLFYDITNAGIIIVKNSLVGKNFLIDCIESINKKCLNKDNSLKGIWAGSCYEQGVINLLIAEKYSNFTTILTNNIIFNYNICSDEVFLMHLYASSNNERVKCFNSNNPAILN